MSRKFPELGFVGYTTIDVNVTPTGESIAPGGAAYFAALAASRLVRPIGLITTVGDDYNSQFLDSRIETTGIRRISDKKTATCTLIYHSDTDPTDRSISMEWGAAEFLMGTDIPQEWLQSLTMIHIATMLPTQQYAVLEYVRKNIPQAFVSIDTDSSLLSDPLDREVVIRSFEQSDLIFANRREYEILAETINRSPHAIVKLDKDGAMYMQHGDVSARSKTRKVKPVDVTGAGDIFAGTFLAARYLQYSHQKALDFAVNVSTISIMQKGINHILNEELI